MSKVKIDIEHVARLASLKLTKAEKKTFEKQLSEVLDYVSTLEKVNTENIEPIGHITDLENIAREDIPSPSQSQEEALFNAPKKHNGFFEVEAIFDND